MIRNTSLPDPRLSHADFPEELMVILSKMLQKSPDDRYQSVDDIYADLSKFIVLN